MKSETSSAKLSPVNVTEQVYQVCGQSSQRGGDGATLAQRTNPSAPLAPVTKQIELSVRVPDTPGAEGRVVSEVVARGVKVHAVSSYSASDHLVVLLVPSDPLLAKQALMNAGLDCKLNSVVVVNLSNRIGAVAELGARLQEAGIEILYSYAAYAEHEEAVAVFKTHDDVRVMEILQAALPTTMPAANQAAA